MGSDLYMEQQSFRSRGYKAEWDNDELVIYRDVFYHGWVEKWRGVPDFDNALVMSLIHTMVKDIPPKPVPFANKVVGVLNGHFDGRISQADAIKELDRLYAEKYNA